jgi:hypothetical protein
MLNIDQLDSIAGNRVCALCVVPEGNLAASDCMLAQKIALETFETKAASMQPCSPQSRCGVRVCGTAGATAGLDGVCRRRRTERQVGAKEWFPDRTGEWTEVCQLFVVGNVRARAPRVSCSIIRRLHPHTSRMVENEDHGQQHRQRRRNAEGGGEVVGRAKRQR